MREPRYAPQGNYGEAFQPRYEAPSQRPAAPPLFQLNQVVAVLTAISAILGARLCLILAGVGAFALALLAISSPNAASLWAQGMFILGVFLPVVYLSTSRAL